MADAVWGANPPSGDDLPNKTLGPGSPPTPPAQAPQQMQPGGAGGTGPIQAPGENTGGLSYPGGPGGYGPISGENMTMTPPAPGGPYGIGGSLPLPLAPGQPPVPGQPVQGLPPGTSTQPGNVAATAPLPYQTFGSIAQVSPTYANAAQIDPASAQQYLNQYQALFGQSLQPTFQRQNEDLQSNLRARGIQDSGSAQQLTNDLYSQQASVMAGGMAPMVSQGFGYAQEDTLGNAGYQQAANLANAGAANSASSQNANYYTGATNNNFNAYNSYLQELYGSGANQENALLSALLNSYGPSTGVTNAMSQGLAGAQNVYGNAYSAATNAATQNNQGMFNSIGALLASGG